MFFFHSWEDIVPSVDSANGLFGWVFDSLVIDDCKFRRVSVSRLVETYCHLSKVWRWSDDLEITLVQERSYSKRSALANLTFSKRHIYNPASVFHTWIFQRCKMSDFVPTQPKEGPENESFNMYFSYSILGKTARCPAKGSPFSELHG